MRLSEPSAAGGVIVVAGSGAAMDLLRDGGAHMVLTSPPYYDEATTGPLLMEPVPRQRERERVRQELEEFARSLAPVFREMARVLKPGGALVLQTKDIRYGGFLLPLAETHRRMAEAEGLSLLTRVSWRKFSYRLRRSAPFQKTQAVGSFQADETEEFLVFAHPCGIDARTSETLDISPTEAALWACPVWESPGAGGCATHPHQSPPEPVRRLIRLYTSPGELVVDPFAGHGTTLIEAVRLSRRAIGYEIDPERAETARRKVARVAPLCRHVYGDTDVRTRR